MPKNETRRDKGIKGEELARRWLMDHGATILATNWRHGHTELDIVAKEQDLIVFVEVKTRSNSRFGHPEENVDWKKQMALSKAAGAFLHEHALGNEIRFDVIAITDEDNDPRIHHIKDAFFPHA